MSGKVGWRIDFVPLFCQGHHPFLVATQSEPLKEERTSLSLELAGGPAGIDRLYLVKSPGVGVGHT